MSILSGRLRSTPKQTSIPMPDTDACALPFQTIREYLDATPGRSPGDYLFPGRNRGGRLSKTARWRALKRAFAEAGIKGALDEMGSHTLRKTFARLLYTALGHDLVRTSYALRHRSVATIVAYLSFREEGDRAILTLRHIFLFLTIKLSLMMLDI